MNYSQLLKHHLFFLFCLISVSAFSQTEKFVVRGNDTLLIHPDTIQAKDLIQSANTDSIMEEMLMQMLQKQGEELAKKRMAEEAAEKRRHDSIAEIRIRTDVTTLKPFHIGYADSLRIQKNLAMQKGVHPLAQELVFMPFDIDMNWVKPVDFGHLYFKRNKQTLRPEKKQPFLADNNSEIIKMRTEARRQLTREMADVYVTTFDKLPSTNKFKADYIQNSSLPEIDLAKNSLFDAQKAAERNKLRVESIALKKWISSASAILQVTQNYISPNWYKGGNSNLAILGILSGSLNYDNKKNMTWENQIEWRAGFNSVSGDTIHKMSTNEDLFRLYTKYGLKAFNKFYYSASAELKTQIFDTYTGVNSTTLTTAFFSPIRFNAAIGMDYKPNKELSVVLSPLSYKYIYVRDTIRIDQTSLGVEADKKHLSEIGSSLRVEYTWKPVDEISVESKFYFYTNYEKIETELEVVCNFIVNRFLTTRISLHPRYDNTVIMADAEKAKIQFKEMISFGFAYKL